MKKLFILLIISFLSYNDTVYSQVIRYKKYTNKAYRLSFDIPDFWAIKYSKAQYGFICVPVTNAQINMYKNCFEGIVFRLDFYKSVLDSVLLKDGLYKKMDDKYYTSDRVSDSIATEAIKGENWTGIYHNNVCGISCKDDGFHAAAGQCQFLYFSKDTTTVCINTNGKELAHKIYKRLLESFRFYR